MPSRSPLWRANWWRQGMMGSAKAHYDGIVAFSQTDFTEDLKKITVPVLVMHSEDDQAVPYVAAGPLSAKLLKNGTLKTHEDFPHGVPTTYRQYTAVAGRTIRKHTLRIGAKPVQSVHRAFRRLSIAPGGVQHVQRKFISGH
jgi:pimeloyl-ACP methyl ester carboxylesterase